MRIQWSVAIVVLGSLAGACATPTLPYGSSVRSAKHAQTAAPKKPTGAVEGLDSQEAAIIARSYHTSLAPKGEKAADDNVIMISPASSSGRPAQPLAPSVPKQ